jgi:CRISPR-associated protein Csa3
MQNPDCSTMRTYISPIGFNSTSVTRPLLSRGIDTGDEVVLIRPDVEDDSRALEAITDVKRLLQEIEPDVSVSTERIPHTDFERAILQCSDIIRAAGEQRIVTLGGGARDVLLPFVMAAITHVRLIDTALFFSDVDGTVREWELPRLTSTLRETTQSTLTALNREGGSSSIPTLTEVTGLSKSTVTRHVNQLTDERLVEVWSEGKTKHARITLTGRLLLRDAS